MECPAVTVNDKDYKEKPQSSVFLYGTAASAVFPFSRYGRVILYMLCR